MYKEDFRETERNIYWTAPRVFIWFLIDPVYVEPRVIVSPHKLHATGDWQE
jgi:hypothetical protein